VPSDNAIETFGLTKVFRSFWRRSEVRALQGVSLHVPRGTTFGLLGPNGAGKTTFVKLVLSCMHPTEGGARIFGRSVWETDARRPVGYLPENHRFPTYMTGAGMLDFYAALAGMEARARKKRIPELLELVELWGERESFITALSHGQQRQVEIILALASKPRLLLLDEPSAGLTTAESVNLGHIVRDLMGDTTVFFCAHDLDLVFSLAERVVVLYYGQLVAQGTPEEIQVDPKVREIYLGTEQEHA
jgi:ABC-2 type transport system ATP-binding protein